MANPTRSYDIVIPPALPPTPPRTFKCPIPTKQALAERAAEAEAHAMARRKKEVVPLPIRFLRLLESRSVQHNSTTPTVFHRMLRRRNSNPNLHFAGYRDLNPIPQVRLRCEMIDTDVIINVEWCPMLFGDIRVLNDMDVTWSSILEEIVKLPKEKGESSDSEDDEEDSVVGELDMGKLTQQTREMNRVDIQTRKAAEEVALLKLSKSERNKRLEAEKAGQLPKPPTELQDGSTQRIIIPRACLQARGWVHKITYKAIHRPSLRCCIAETKLRVAPKGQVWKCLFDEPDAFVEVFSRHDSEEEGNQSDGSEESEGPPDPFADVNESRVGTADVSFDEGSESKMEKVEQPDRIAGTSGGLIRGKYENDQDWLSRLETELEAAIVRRKEELKKKEDQEGSKLQFVEETKSVFDTDSQKVSSFTKQFIAQEIADEKLAKSKLENKWNGPRQNDLQGSVLNLGGRALERDDLDALGWILRRNWGICKLDLSRCAIDDAECLKLLSDLRLNTVLRSLDLRKTRLTDNGAKICMEILSEKSGIALKLEELDLRHCRAMGMVAGEYYHEYLDRLQPTLKKLNGISLQTIRETREKLDLSGIQLGLSEVNFLRLRIFDRITYKPTRHQRLSIASSSIDDDSSTCLSLNSLNSMTEEKDRQAVGIKELVLKGCGLTPQSCEIICESLINVGEIEVLDLSDNGLFLEGANYIAKLVSSTSSVKRLRLMGCNLQWAPEMVEAQRIKRSKGIKAVSMMKKKQEQYKAFDPAEDLNPSALFVLADIAKRLKQLEECALSDDDAQSEAARQIMQSLAINRSLAFQRHVDLVEKVVPKVPEPKNFTQSKYELTLDVDSRFLLKEKLLHLNAVGIVLNESELQSDHPSSRPPSSVDSGGGNTDNTISNTLKQSRGKSTTAPPVLVKSHVIQDTASAGFFGESDGYYLH